jgi:bifunctional UDP-N-acetylglucosamine pyrophosphorylase/glucosamine-1-phosphate N-acetyltransferase
MQIVILAAGQGKRMRSALPKVLQPLSDRPLLGHVLRTAAFLSPSHTCIVFGHGGDAVRAAFPDAGVAWALQADQLGTGHAVMQALPALSRDEPVMVLYGDVPLLRAETLARLAEAAGDDKLGILTVMLDDPSGYGRIVRDAAGRILRIVEQKDASDGERKIREVNTGIMVVPGARLAGWLTHLSNDNAQREYYLTDVVAAAVRDGVPVVSTQPERVSETLGVNDKAQLAELERIHQRENAERLLADGVTLRDPARIDMRGELICGRDVEIDIGCIFEGRVELGDGVCVGLIRCCAT